MNDSKPTLRDFGNVKILNEFDYKKNSPITPDTITVGSNKKLWWIGECGHSYKMRLSSKVNSEKCQVCANNIIVEGINDCSAHKPDLVINRWNPTKNGHRTPYNTYYNSEKIKIWFVCEKNHEWVQVIRYAQGICPTCEEGKSLFGIEESTTVLEDHNNNDLTTYNNNLNNNTDTIVDSKYSSIENLILSDVHQTINEIDDNDLLKNHYESFEQGALFPDDQLVVGVDTRKTRLNENNQHVIYPLNKNNSTIKNAHDARNEFYVINEMKEILELLDNEKNSSVPELNFLDYNKISSTSHKEFYFSGECKHQWKSSLRAVNKLICPTCYPNRSSMEIELSRRLEKLDYFVSDYRNIKINSSYANCVECDIVLPSQLIVIEYDGVKYHHDKIKRDSEKSIALLDEGWCVIRIRDESLPSLNINHDEYFEIKFIESKSQHHRFKAINKVFAQIIYIINMLQDDDRLILSDSRIPLVENNNTKKNNDEFDVNNSHGLKDNPFEERYFGLKEAARECGVSLSTIQRHRDTFLKNGATRDVEGWKIPLRALNAAGLTLKITASNNDDEIFDNDTSKVDLEWLSGIDDITEIFKPQNISSHTFEDSNNHKTYNNTSNTDEKILKNSKDDNSIVINNNELSVSDKNVYDENNNSYSSNEVNNLPRKRSLFKKIMNID